MKNIMSRAWEIRKQASTKWNCDIMDIHFGLCLKMAHMGEVIMVDVLRDVERYRVTINENDPKYVDVEIKSDFSYTLKHIKDARGRKWDGNRKVWMVPADVWEYELGGIAR